MEVEYFDPSIIRRKSSEFSRDRSLTGRTLAGSSLFICHSFKDRDLARGVACLLLDIGISVYIDWLDEEMPASPSRRTAKRLKSKIRESDFFLFLATKNSRRSRWCPWEIGYADGVKRIDEIFMAPFEDDEGDHGSEYLQLYRRIDPRLLARAVRKGMPYVASHPRMLTQLTLNDISVGPFL